MILIDNDIGTIRANYGPGASHPRRSRVSRSRARSRTKENSKVGKYDLHGLQVQRDLTTARGNEIQA